MTVPVLRRRPDTPGRERQAPRGSPSRLPLVAALAAACSSSPTSPQPDLRAPGRVPGPCTAYVASDGDDSRPGTSAEPWRSFEYAARVARPGDVICFEGGNYPTRAVVLSRSGAPGSPITYQASSSESVTLDGHGAGSVITVAPGVSHLRLSGFVITGYTVWGVSVDGGNRDIELSRLDVSGGDSGVHLTVGNSGEPPEHGPVEQLTIEDSAIHGVRFTAVDCTPGPCNDVSFRRLEIYGAGFAGERSFGADGLAVERGRNILVSECRVRDNSGDGIDLNSRDRSGSVHGVVVERNEVFRNRLQGIKLWAGGRMEGNAIWGQGFAPVSIGMYPGSYEVVNNTMAYNMWDAAFSTRSYSFVVAYDSAPSRALDLILTDNIFAFNTGPDVGTPTGIYLGAAVRLRQESGNVFFSRAGCEIDAAFLPGASCFTQEDIRNGSWARATGMGDSTTVADPMFVSRWPSVDLHLRSGSPAAGRGAF